MKIAVVGAGIAGISAAWHLDQAGHVVDVFESGLRLGGHTDTHQLQLPDGPVKVDTGFIVFNDHNYPQFSGWLDQLGVKSNPSNMSFAVRDELARLEYGTTDLSAIVAHKKQWLKPDYWRLWWDLARFYRDMKDGDIPALSLGDYVRANGYSDAFVYSHILPMCAALWSQPVEASLELSLEHVIEFMRNHRMLQVAERPLWHTVAGGSASYVEAFRRSFTGNVYTHSAVTAVKRGQHTASLTAGGVISVYDAVVLACHSDQALALLEAPMPIEREVLAALPYQHNDVYLHGDASFMPANKKCWSSWNVVRDVSGRYVITYWMNLLQKLQCKQQLFVTLNPTREPASIIWQGPYQHPHFTADSHQAQKQWSQISQGTVHFAGAYWGKGFHEDGFASGKQCAEAISTAVAVHAA